METKTNKRINTPRKSRENDPQTPSKPISRPSSRMLEKRRKNSENECSPYEDEPQTPKSARRSTRIQQKQAKSVEKDNSINDVLHLIDEMEVENERPSTNYFSENPDFHHGQDIFSFRTPKKKGAMVAMAQNTPKASSLVKSVGTPKTPRTPKSSRTSIQPKTPGHIRSKLKRGLRKNCKDVDEDEDFADFEESDDEYEPLQSSDSDSESSSSSDSEDDSPVKHVQHSIQKTIPARKTRNSTRQQQDLVFESDKYFGQTNKKNATSDNTLDSLKTPRLQHEELFKLLADHKISHSHQNCMRDLQSHYETFFPKWLFILKEGFNILLYGLGSKRNILEILHSKVLAHENVLVVNGYFPSLTIKDILDDIVTGLLETTCKSKNLYEIVDVIEEEMKLTPEYNIFLIIHNLDGTMLRNDMAQNVLSRLVHIPNIYLIASIDHINAPNLWDNIQLSNYNFSWWDVSSFLPYTDETSVVENSMLLKNSVALTISSMKSVLLSLTHNARGIYIIIVENQLASNKTSNYQGMPFKNLYKKCLESFLVSSDIVLRTQLTEFCDHNLLKLKRTADGTEQLKIPIDSILLQQFVEQYNNWSVSN